MDDIKAKYEHMMEKRREYQNRYKAKKRGAFLKKLEEGDEEAKAELERRREKNRVYQQQYLERHAKALNAKRRERYHARKDKTTDSA